MIVIQGVFIMIIFVAKRSVARKLARRFGFEERGAAYLGVQVGMQEKSVGPKLVSLG